MTIWRKDEETGLTCGINDDGNLFLGDDYSGYNLPDTPKIVNTFWMTLTAGNLEGE